MNYNLDTNLVRWHLWHARKRLAELELNDVDELYRLGFNRK